ncbi:MULTISPECIES: beta-lactamase hydrolase domain-containing protein [Fischerella]|uniref:Phosphatase n=1 Tax=Fischerella muscicola CCMEE 5323 TaxID=2019572 RepID=A0A2N6K3N5_FISMU|nr:MULTISPECIES: sulfur transferase domain-containing protein [Fischerella]MBD2433440.1 tyrosine-protein phosphatase [Fischerella sp. FACHB-380]PLZ90222.1 phosphatase [Fischerella muscicola CCMEE 5323]
MTEIKKISDQFSAAGQVSPEDLQQAAQAGFKSVLNLRSPAETGFVNDEQEQANAVGLEYANIPLSPTQANQESLNQAIQEIENLPKPILVHCAAGARASAIALIAAANQQGLTPEQVKQKAQELSLKLEQPHLQQFLQEESTIS